MCKTFRVLPRPGGLLDQDSLFVYLAEQYESALNEKAERDNEKMQAEMKRAKARR